MVHSFGEGINLEMNGAREKQNALTAHDDAIATMLTVQFTTAW